MELLICFRVTRTSHQIGVSSTLLFVITRLNGARSTNLMIMKKLIVMLLCGVLLPGTLLAQDLITKKDGTNITAKILEVSPNAIKYKDWSNLDGPTFILRTSDVLIVRYENGQNQLFDAEESIVDLSSYSNIRYKSIKDLYEKENYFKLSDPYYSLGRPWLNLLVPGLAQYTMAEPELGTRFLIMGLSGEALASAGVALWSRASSAHNYNSYAIPGFIGVVLGSALIITSTIWSINNAYNVAKVKSLYIEDKKNNLNYSLSFAPTVTLSATPNGVKPIPAIGLSVTF